jgi:UDP-galactopyranose mutase
VYLQYSVQFVPFNKYRNDPLQLSKQTLAEIPTQLVQYMKSKKIVPNEALCRENTAFFTGTKLN